MDALTVRELLEAAKAAPDGRVIVVGTATCEDGCDVIGIWKDQDGNLVLKVDEENAVGRGDDVPF